MLDNTAKKELKYRVEAKQHELQARIAQLKADGTKASKDAIDKVQAKLDEAEQTLSDGWNNLSESAASRLNQWLAN